MTTLRRRAHRVARRVSAPCRLCGVGVPDTESPDPVHDDCLADERYRAALATSRRLGDHELLRFVDRKNPRLARLRRAARRVSLERRLPVVTAGEARP